MPSWIDQWTARFVADPSPKDVSQPFMRESLQKVRALKGKMTRDAQGRQFIESDPFEAAVHQLDEQGLTGSADELLCDALLVHPSSKYRYLLGRRLARRGRLDEANALLAQLTEHPQWANAALKLLAQIAEREHRPEDARNYLERALAWNYLDNQAQEQHKRLQQQNASHKELKPNYFFTSLVRGAKIVGKDYKLKRLLGRGGAATVFQGETAHAHQTVALKVFHRSAGSKNHCSKALREAQVTARVDHPHVVTLLDVDEAQGYIVMTYCNGGSLRDRLKKERLPLTEVFDLATVLLRTLADIHARGLIHLDIKPSNILFHHGVPVLSDFGIASESDAKRRAGTQAYMAPEQRQGNPSPQSDVYATGLVLAECLLGRQRTDAESALRLEPLPNGPRRRALELLLRAMTEPDAQKRPADLHVLANRFQWAQAMPESDAQGTALLERMRAWAHKEGAHVAQSLEKHPIVAYLSPVDLNGG